MAKNKKPKKFITKAGAKERRLGTDNLNQKSSVFADKRTKREKTRQAVKDKALEGELGK